MSPDLGRKGRAFILVLLASCLVVSLGQANMSAPLHSPSVLWGPRGGPTALVIDRERLLITCQEAAGHSVSCRFEARYTVSNPTGQSISLTPGFLSERVEGIALFIDGVRSDRELNKAEVQALIPEPEAETPHEGNPADSAPGAEPGLTREQRDFIAQAAGVDSVRGVDLQVAPGQTRKMRATGRLLPGEVERSEGYGFSARDARHLLLRPRPRTNDFEIQYLISPIRTWAKVGPIEVVIRYPDSWSPWVHTTAHKQVSSRPGNTRELRFVTTPELNPRLDISFQLPDRSIHPGGPIAGIGGTFGDAGGFRMRFGWEFGAPDWLLYSATLDTDFGSNLTVTPLVEAATPTFLIIPSLGAGLGIPVRVKPEAHMGARLQGSMAFGPLAWVTSFDWFPGIDAERPDDKQVTMMFVLTL